VINIRKFNSMGGRSFVVTQSIKKLSNTLKEAVFNDYDYRILSSESPVNISYMKNFDRHKKENLDMYNDFAYKVIAAHNYNLFQKNDGIPENSSNQTD